MIKGNGERIVLDMLSNIQWVRPSGCSADLWCKCCTVFFLNLFLSRFFCFGPFIPPLPSCRYTQGRFQCTDGDVSEFTCGFFDGFFSVPHHTHRTPNTHHDHQQHHTTDTTCIHHNTTSHKDRERGRQRKKTEKEREEKMKEERQDKTREDKTRQDEREDKTRQEKMEVKMKEKKRGERR